MTQAERPTFLTTPDRSSKPRTVGLTHVLDKGTPLDHLRSHLAAIADYVDMWKFGWGTAYMDPQVGAKLVELGRHDIRGCTGGTLLEIAWLQGRQTEFFDWASGVGFPAIEVSDGATAMPATDKRSLIAEARHRGFDVLAEVGSKDPSDHATLDWWVDEITADVEAGAHLVVAEGRESGTVGLYEADGSVRVALVEAIEERTDGIGIIYEAPRRSQQAWLIRNIGPQVNLGNIVIGEIVGVESLRLGLRTDTLTPTDTSTPAP